jgi:hypothetical protein
MSAAVGSSELGCCAMVSTHNGRDGQVGAFETPETLPHRVQHVLMTTEANTKHWAAGSFANGRLAKSC